MLDGTEVFKDQGSLGPLEVAPLPLPPGFRRSPGHPGALEDIAEPIVRERPEVGEPVVPFDAAEITRQAVEIQERVRANPFIPVQPSPKQLAFLMLRQREALFGGAAGGGKLLVLHERVATPSGWTTMGALRAGDVVFDEYGQPTRVTRAFAPETPRHAYRLRFDDGEEVTAGEEHLWLTFNARELEALTKRTDDYRARRRAVRPSRATGSRGELVTALVTARNQAAPPVALTAPIGTVRTTAELAATLRTPSGRANHAIPVAGALDLPEAELPLDPYLLGLWLGDGTTSAGQMTTMDQEVVQAFVTGGFPTGSVQRKPGNQSRDVTLLGLRTALRLLGVFGSKHVPMAYLRGSRRQRLELLRGLMDTDGTVCSAGQRSNGVEFTTTSPALRDGAHELIVSLGWKVRVVEGRAKLNGRDYGPKWDLKWTPSEYVFRLDRKRSLQGLAERRTTQFRYLVACDEVAPEPMRCIAVDSPSHLYLVGRAMIPTHNSFCLLMGAAMWIDHPKHAALILRKNYGDLTLPEALLDIAHQWWQGTAAHWHAGKMTWEFPSGATITFGHMQDPNSRFRYQGAAFTHICWDELCMHPATEVLTQSGWTKIADVTLDDRVLSLAPDWTTQYAPVSRLYTMPFDGELHETTHQRIRYSVTPKHRLVIAGQRNGRWRFSHADDLPAYAHFPFEGQWAGVEMQEVLLPAPPQHRGMGRNQNSAPSVAADDYLAFLGWYLAEGSCWESKSRAGPTISIRQTKEQPALATLMARLPFRHRFTADEGYLIFSRQLFEHLRPLGNTYSKRVPRWVMALSTRQLRIFFDAFVLGDGHALKTGAVNIGLANEGLIDDLQEIATKLGHRSRKSHRMVASAKGRPKQYHSHELYVYGKKGGPVRVSPAQKRQVPYSGPVHCIQVEPHHTFLCRYEGRVFWSGNTQFQELEYRYLLSRLRRPPDVDVPLMCRAASNPGGRGHAFVKERFVLSADPQVVFLPALLDDNPYLDRAQYLEMLEALDLVTRQQLLEGNWDAIPAGHMFRRDWFPVINVSQLPKIRHWVRFWDCAATAEPRPGEAQGDPDYTVGMLLGQDYQDRVYIADVVRGRWAPQGVENVVMQTANEDGRLTAVRMEQEGGSSGRTVIETYARKLRGFDFKGVPSSGAKEVRAAPVSAMAGRGDVILVNTGSRFREWYMPLMLEVEAFQTPGVHDDQVDALSGAVNSMSFRTDVGSDLAYRNQALARTVPLRMPTGHGLSDIFPI